MKREIKFRAWNHKSGMYYNVCVDNYGNANKDHSFLTYDKEKDGVMQFTGLYDKEGKEIYEGDIVKFFDITSDKYILNKGYDTCVVNYIKIRCAFHPQDIEKNNRGGNYIHYWEQIDEIEVIGNIYENPEKLK